MLRHPEQRPLQCILHRRCKIFMLLRHPCPVLARGEPGEEPVALGVIDLRDGPVPVDEVEELRMRSAICGKTHRLPFVAVWFESEDLRHAFIERTPAPRIRYSVQDMQISPLPPSKHTALPAPGTVQRDEVRFLK